MKQMWGKKRIRDERDDCENDGDTKFDTRLRVSKALFDHFLLLFHWGGADVLISSYLLGLLAFIVVEVVERALVMP